MHKLGNNVSYNTFGNETDTSITVRLKCPSYCQFYMHIISIIVLYMLYSRIYKYRIVLAYLWHEFHNQDDYKRCHMLNRKYQLKISVPRHWKSPC